MIKHESITLKCRHGSLEQCQKHINEISLANKSKILDIGIGSDNKGHYSWIKVKEWIDE